MNLVTCPTGPPAFSLAARGHPDFALVPGHAPPATAPRDHEFVALCAACRSLGGVARAEELARRLADGGAPLSGVDGHRPQAAAASDGDLRLARLILGGELFSFGWQHQVWVPMFQLQPQDLAVRPAVRQVTAELVADFDGWSLAEWYLAPNSWLGARRPVDLLDDALPAVLEAARADRFMAVC